MRNNFARFLRSVSFVRQYVANLRASGYSIGKYMFIHCFHSARRWWIIYNITRRDTHIDRGEVFLPRRRRKFGNVRWKTRAAFPSRNKAKLSTEHKNGGNNVSCVWRDWNVELALEETVRVKELSLTSLAYKKKQIKTFQMATEGDDMFLRHICIISIDLSVHPFFKTTC